MRAVPETLRNSLVALVLLTGLGGGAYVADQAITQEMQRNEYVKAVASDTTTSDAVKIAMVMGNFYESSNEHIGKPYIDRNGRGRPLTVCNGVTGREVVASRYYTPTDCYRLERSRYIQAESESKRRLRYWGDYDPFTRAVFIDFVWTKGSPNLDASTMLRKANAGDLMGACRENTRWNRGTVNGVSTVLPGLTIRGNSNDEICRTWRAEAQS